MAHRCWWKTMTWLAKNAREEAKKHWISIELVIMWLAICKTLTGNGGACARCVNHPQAKKQEKFFPSFFVTVFYAVDCEWLVGRSRFLIRFYDLNCEACQADDDVIIFAMITYESCGSGLDQRSSPRLRAGDEEIDSDHSFFRFDFRCDNLRRREIKKFAIVLWSQRQHHRFATKQILKMDKSHLPSERNDSGGMEEILCATFHRRTPDTTPTEWHLVWRKITAWHWF